MPTPRPPCDPEPAPNLPVPPAPKDRGKSGAPGILSINSDPWAWVVIAGQKQETPAKFYLAPGDYTIKIISGDDSNVLKYDHVTIRGNGETQKLTFDMDSR